MSQSPYLPDDPDDEKQELMAMLAAGRELPEDMDRSLVESYLERRKAAQPKQQQMAVQAAGNGAPLAATNPGLAIAGMGLLLAVYVVALIVTHGWLWWLIFPLLGMGGGAFGLWGDHERQQARQQRRLEREQVRHEYRMARLGYEPRAERRQLPQEPAPAPRQPENAEGSDTRASGQ